MKYLAKQMRRDILKITSKSKTSHIGGSLSIVEILLTLYLKIMNINPKKPNSKNRDRFILSKGHCVIALYAVLSKKGFFSNSVLQEYCTNGGKLAGHPDIKSVPGIEASTGSLGHGLPIGVGMAIAAKYDKLSYKVFVLMSDGECNEGSVWEAAMNASRFKLDNLCIIVDSNKLQAFEKSDAILPSSSFVDKFSSFGCSVKEVNGHDFVQLKRIFDSLPFEKRKPSVIIAHTIKGKGVSFMEDRLEWHYKSPDEEQLQKALKELED